MRINNITVKGLFGLFDHSIPLNSDDRITIIYGPNGFGKTYTLNLVNELFTSGYRSFYEIPFTEIAVGFSDLSTLRARKTAGKGRETVTIELTKPRLKTKSFTLSESSKKKEPLWLITLKRAVTVQFVSTERLLRFSKELHSESITMAKSTSKKVHEKIALLLKIINSRFTHKKMELSTKDGFVFIASDGRQLKPQQLSSGEQHVLVLLYQLLFTVKSDSLILIDEPELSLHVFWQQQFIRDMQDIIRLSGFDILIATHSPQIIHDRWDLAVELKDPRA